MAKLKGNGKGSVHYNRYPFTEEHRLFLNRWREKPLKKLAGGLVRHFGITRAHADSILVQWIGPIK